MSIAGLSAGALALLSSLSGEVLGDTGGLKKAPHWELVRAHCGGCHSLNLVTSQRGDRAFWLKTIRWMQKTQNLWPLPADQEEKILHYLSAQYPAEAWGRRPALGPQLMPQRGTPER
ncbi:MAG: hypothetical protein AB8B96_08195 [Lysobacterales bacterium]